MSAAPPELPSTPTRDRTFNHLPLSPGRVPKNLVDLAAHDGISGHLSTAIESAPCLWDVQNHRNPGLLEFPKFKEDAPENDVRVDEWLRSTKLPANRRHTIANIPRSPPTEFDSPPPSPSRRRWKRYLPSLKRSPSSQSVITTQSAPSTPTRGHRLSLASIRRWSPKAHSSPDLQGASEDLPESPSRRGRRLSLASFCRWTSPSPSRSRRDSGASPNSSNPSISEFGTVCNPSESAGTSILGEASACDGHDTDTDTDTEIDETESEDDESIDSEDSEETFVDCTPLFSSEPTGKLTPVSEDDEIGLFFTSHNPIDDDNTVEIHLDTEEAGGIIEDEHCDDPYDTSVDLIVALPNSKSPPRPDKQYTSPMNLGLVDGALHSITDFNLLPWPSKETHSVFGSMLLPHRQSTAAQPFAELPIRKKVVGIHAQSLESNILWLIYSFPMFLFASYGPTFLFEVPVDLSHLEIRFGRAFNPQLDFIVLFALSLSKYILCSIPRSFIMPSPSCIY